MLWFVSSKHAVVCIQQTIAWFDTNFAPWAGLSRLWGRCGELSARSVRRPRRPQVLVWDLETLALERALPQPAGTDVRYLVGGDGELWAGVGEEVVVWGR